MSPAPTADSPTLRTLTGLPAEPARLGESPLILIDCQNTYTRGVMELDGVQTALDEVAVLLDRARTAGSTIIHIQHFGGPGSLYDLEGENGAIVDRVAPIAGEIVVVKKKPNAFVGTELDAHLRALDASSLVLAGFMTHMCVNSTARAAFSLGYAPTVVARATATRALTPVGGDAVSAPHLQTASLAGLSDLFAVVVSDASLVID